ncbi:MAG: hypothetical protein QXR30_04145 [Candidatus Woesearchaeota archaeon]
MGISNEELSAYIKKRRELYGFSNPLQSTNKKNVEKTSFLDKVNFFKNLVGKKEKNVVKLTPEIKEADEMIDEIDTNKKIEEENVKHEKTGPLKIGFVEKIKQVFIKKQDNVYVEETIEDDVVELDYEEIRQAFKIANSLIKKLPPAVLKAFKESDSYPIYVNTMRKLKLVKEKTREDE